MVSHSLNSLKDYCDVALFLQRDERLIYFENIAEAISMYRKEESL